MVKKLKIVSTILLFILLTSVSFIWVNYYDSTNEKINSYQHDIEKYTSDIRLLENDNVSLRNIIDDKSNDINKLELENNKLENNLNKLDIQYSDVKDLLSQKESEIESLYDIISTQNETINQLNIQLEYKNGIVEYYSDKYDNGLKNFASLDEVNKWMKHIGIWGIENVNCVDVSRTARDNAYQDGYWLDRVLLSHYSIYNTYSQYYSNCSWYNQYMNVSNYDHMANIAVIGNDIYVVDFTINKIFLAGKSYYGK